jgi:hypothetical protein
MSTLSFEMYSCLPPEKQVPNTGYPVFPMVRKDVQTLVKAGNYSFDALEIQTSTIQITFKTSPF